MTLLGGLNLGSGGALPDGAPGAVGGERGGVGHGLRDGSCDECRKGSTCGDAIMVEIVQQVPKDEWMQYSCSNVAVLCPALQWKMPENDYSWFQGG